MDQSNKALFDKCTSPKSFLFVQHKCLNNIENQFHKWMHNSIGAVTTLMVGFLIMMLVYYERSMAEINKAK